MFISNNGSMDKYHASQHDSIQLKADYNKVNGLLVMNPGDKFYPQKSRSVAKLSKMADTKFTTLGLDNNNTVD